MWEYLSITISRICTEMPHDALDIVLSKKFGKQVEVKLNAKDVIGRDAVFKQFPGV